MNFISCKHFKGCSFSSTIDSQKSENLNKVDFTSPNGIPKEILSTATFPV